MKYASTVAMLAATLIVAGTGSALAKSDKAFIHSAIQGDMAEVQLGNLALQRSSNPDVKAFAQMLVKDHSGARADAEKVGQQIGVTAPTGPSAKQKATIARLGKLSGERFDRKFVNDMIQDHRKDIAAYKRAATRSGPVAKLAQTTLPTLQKHLKAVVALQPKVAASSM